MLYERLKGRKNLTPLEERIVLLVSLRMDRLRYSEMEIIAMAGRNEANNKALDALLSRYREEMFPGTEKPRDSFEDLAKKKLAEETKKLYLVTPLQGRKKQSRLQDAVKSANPAIRKWAAEEIDKETIAQQRLAKRLKRSGRPLPPGTTKF